MDGWTADEEGGSGSEIGPFRAIEESTLAQLTPKEGRSDVFAWYTLIGTAGSAFGTILCGVLVERLKMLEGWSPLGAYRVVFAIYAGLGVLKLILSLMLSPACEPEQPKPSHMETEDIDIVEAEGLLENDGNTDSEPSTPASRTFPPPTLKPKPKKSIWPSISPSSRFILIKICLLFAVDSLGSGIMPASWITYFFTSKFSLPEGQLGTLFFATNIITSASNLVASSLSKRIGLIKTMVFTHLPSAICLALIPLPSNLFLAMTFLVLRACTQSMDQAPRQAFLAAAVLPAERTAVMGIVNVVKTLAQSGGPSITGWLVGIRKFWIAFLVAGSLKASYDLGMLGMFLGFRGREEEGEDVDRRSRGSVDGERGEARGRK